MAYYVKNEDSLRCVRLGEGKDVEFVGLSALYDAGRRDGLYKQFSGAVGTKIAAENRNAVVEDILFLADLPEIARSRALLLKAARFIRRAHPDHTVRLT